MGGQPWWLAGNARTIALLQRCFKWQQHLPPTSQAVKSHWESQRGRRGHPNFLPSSLPSFLPLHQHGPARHRGQALREVSTPQLRSGGTGSAAITPPSPQINKDVYIYIIYIYILNKRTNKQSYLGAGDGASGLAGARAGGDAAGDCPWGGPAAWPGVPGAGGVTGPRPPAREAGTHKTGEQGGFPALGHPPAAPQGCSVPSSCSSAAPPQANPRPLPIFWRPPKRCVSPPESSAAAGGTAGGAGLIPPNPEHTESSRVGDERCWGGGRWGGAGAPLCTQGGQHRPFGGQGLVTLSTAAGGWCCRPGPRSHCCWSAGNPRSRPRR